MDTFTTTFQVVKVTAQKAGKCGICGKRTKRSRTFEASVNPYNKNENGSPKCYSEVHADVSKECDEWLGEPLFCTNCE